MRSHPSAILCIVVLACALAASPARAAPKDDVKGAFTHFVNAQNAHDLKAIGNLLADSPDFLWISSGHVVRERGAALQRFEQMFKGKWRVDPDWSTFQILGLDFTTMEIFVRVSTSDGGSVRKARMSLVLVNTPKGWQVQNIFVSDAQAT